MSLQNKKTPVMPEFFYKYRLNKLLSLSVWIISGVFQGTTIPG
jgi:hypothetical protein